jgi:hypothetical protein
MRSRRMRWAGYLAHMGKVTDAYKKFCQTARRLKGRDHLGSLVIGGRDVLK